MSRRLRRGTRVRDPKKKKGRSFPRRPKSREETPKEGSAISLPHCNKMGSSEK
mgnify:CR=1 FL=1